MEKKLDRNYHDEIKFCKTRTLTFVRRLLPMLVNWQVRVGAVEAVDGMAAEVAGNYMSKRKKRV